MRHRKKAQSGQPAEDLSLRPSLDSHISSANMSSQSLVQKSATAKQPSNRHCGDCEPQSGSQAVKAGVSMRHVHARSAHHVWQAWWPPHASHAQHTYALRAELLVAGNVQPDVQNDEGSNGKQGDECPADSASQSSKWV